MASARIPIGVDSVFQRSVLVITILMHVRKAVTYLPQVLCIAALNSFVGFVVGLVLLREAQKKEIVAKQQVVH